MTKKTKVNLIAGFLGSGKTTVLRQFLAQAKVGERVAVLVHDLQEMRVAPENIDKTPDAVTQELKNGCVVRQISKTFSEDLASLAAMGVDRVLIEASGSADPGRFINTLLESNLMHQYRVEPTIVVVDVSSFARLSKKLAYHYIVHIKAGDILLLNKTDRIPAEELDTVVRELKSLNPRAFQMSTLRGKLDLIGVLEGRAPAGDREKPEGPHFEYCTVLTSGVLDRLKLEAVFNELPDSVYRAKGYVHFSSGPHLVDFVAGNFSYEPVAHTGDNELVFIGSEVPRAKITAAIKKCMKNGTKS